MKLPHVTPKERELALLFCILFLMALSFYAGMTNARHKEQSREDEREIIIHTDDVRARAAIAIDATTGDVLFERDADHVLPLASLTKVMATLVVLDSIPKDETITISDAAVKEEGDNGLKAGYAFHRDDLLAFMLVESSNDAAHAFREVYEGREGRSFIDAMNEKAIALDMPTLHFRTEHGLDTEEGSGGEGSARDVAALLLYVWEHASDIFSETGEQLLAVPATLGDETIVLTAENTNKAILAIPGRVLSKTGMTDLAGGNLGMVVEKGPLHPIIIVVLGSTEYGRFDDVETIAHHIFAI